MSSSRAVVKPGCRRAGLLSGRAVIGPGCRRAGLSSGRRTGTAHLRRRATLSVAGEDVGGRSHLPGQVLTGLGLGGLTHLLFRLADGAA